MTAIEQLRRAVADQGSHPHYHRGVEKIHRSEWPTLWAAIDRLLSEAPK